MTTELFFKTPSRPFVFKQTENLLLITSDTLTKNTGIKFFYTTRIGGVSSGPFRSLNFYARGGDSPEKVKKNFELLLSELGISGMKRFAGEQVHSNKIEFISDDLNISEQPVNLVKGADGLITTAKRISLISFFADCLPVFIFEKKNGIFGTVHSGWRSTALNIIKNAVHSVIEKGGELQNIKIVLGPAIDMDNYEVGNDVIEKFKENKESDNLVYKKAGEKFKIDISATVNNQLSKIGINPANIFSVNLSTFKNKELFFSYRRDGKPVGENILIAYKI